MRNTAPAISSDPAHGGPRQLAIDVSASVVRYGIVHRLHRVSGRSANVQGKATLDPDGTVVAGVLVPVASFRSGDDDRDARTVEILGTFVVFKGKGHLPPGQRQAQVTMQGELTVHAVRRPLTVTLTVELEPDGAARVRGGFELSLEGHRVERPSLLFVKVGDICKIELDLLMRDATEPRGR